MPHKLLTFMDTWRIGRVFMLACVAGATAYGFGGTARVVLLTTASAAFLAWAGFFLDYLADWRTDRLSGKQTNPIATGILSLRAGWALVSLAVVVSAVLGMLASPWTLLPIAGVIAVVSGLALGILDTPVLRAVSLGTLQGLYVLLGGLAAGPLSLGLCMLALFLLFAMTGGRVMGDVRDQPRDEIAGIRTIPRVYGLRWASVFLVINEVAAYATALLVAATGVLGRGYLYCVLAIVVLGVGINSLFIARPTPKTADATNRMSLGLLGGLYILGMILGRL